MEILKLYLKPELLTEHKTNRLYQQWQTLLGSLGDKKISAKTAETINQEVEAINATSLRDKSLQNLLKVKQTFILTLLEKEEKLVPKNHYRNRWLALGLSAFGLPLGVFFGLLLGNMGLIGIGLPIGMGIGIAVGTSMDKKAETEGRQLEMEIKY
ncbi:hypothetical protein [uncultured Chryseobacterium sp.]|uniref:hypothetical protein n=1 Tax=uncultured Chryseobacterium sp. TaxID=259322 RepID=UPI0025CE0850|nr:hypothetical protein [uncultured Chryseobacterium sp.]